MEKRVFSCTNTDKNLLITNKADSKKQLQVELLYETHMSNADHEGEGEKVYIIRNSCIDK